MTTLEFVEKLSVFERYADVVSGIPERGFVEQAQIREGVAIIDGPTVDGVALKWLDLSTLSATGTFKDWVACVTVAHCLQHGIRRFVTQSSGNTANALALYGARAGIQVVALYPRSSRYKIDSAIAAHPLATFIEVDKSEPQLKALTRETARRYGVPWLADIALQRKANKLRAYVIHEWITTRGVDCDWHAQALSSAYGPIGTYSGLDEIAGGGRAPMRAPRFLGIQQEAVQPFAAAILGYEPPHQPAAVIEPTLFRTQPSSRLLDAVRWICASTGGTVRVARNEVVERRQDEMLEILAASGLRPVQVATVEGGCDILERAGLVCLAGVLEAIECGLIERGESVLVALTGGFQLRTSAPYEPCLRLDAEGEAEDLWSMVEAATGAVPAIPSGAGLVRADPGCL